MAAPEKRELFHYWNNHIHFMGFCIDFGTYKVTAHSPNNVVHLQGAIP
jgi:hypothetical protein